ncbi:MAG TPA: hypothetical protein VFV99_18375 [Kofleriaceae bacterium]|nr:hypothetical protein [Kofleriaceae bacterium]
MNDQQETVSPAELDAVTGGVGWRCTGFRVPTGFLGGLNISITSGNNKVVAQGNLGATTLADNQPVK